MTTNTSFICWATSTCKKERCLFLVCICLGKDWLFLLLIYSLFPISSILPKFCMSSQYCCPKTAPTQSGWAEAGWLSESIPESAAHPLPASCDSHSSSFSLPRVQASSSSARRNDPSVWLAQNPESPHFGVWVQIPPPKGRAGTPANDSEMQRVSALVSWNTKALCELSCTFFP